MFGWRLIRVVGQSMEPVLPAGSYALFRRRPDYQSGDTVLAQHPRYGRIVKSVAEVSGDYIRLEGVHPSSVSKEAMGQLPIRTILGKLIGVVRPPASNSSKLEQEP